MHKTRIFKIGDSQAVEIPSELAYDQTIGDFEIERNGDEIHIRPVRRSLAGVLATFSKFSPDFLQDGRGEHEQAERAIR